MAVTRGLKTPRRGQSERQRQTDRRKNRAGGEKKRRSKESGAGEKRVKCLATWSGGKSPTELGAQRPGGEMKCLICRWQDSVL